MRVSQKIAVFVSALVLAPAISVADVLLHADFDNHPLGQYTREMAAADFPYPGYTWFSNNLEAGRGEIVKGREGGGNALRLLYPKGEIGSSSTVQIRAALAKAVDTAWASYWVKFDEPFDFVKGGKLPGLCGGECITGGNDANGYNGWSARIMWRGGGAATQYMYYVTNSGYGEDLVFDKSAPEKRFTPGKWHRVNTQIIMNTPQASDGTIRSWFDGELAMERTNILIRNTDTLKIDLFYISTFFGGSDPSWAPPEDTYITFDDFLVVSGPESSPYPQLLYELSATSGRLGADGAFTVYADLSASLGTGLGYDVRGPAAPLNTSDGWSGKATFNAPGVADVLVGVSGGGREDYASRRVFILGERDLMCDNEWQAMPLGETLGTGDTLRMWLTIADTSAIIRVGPAVNEAPTGDSHFYGILKYENGKFSAVSGNNSPSNFVDAAEPVEAGIGAYEVKFTFDFTPASANRTYSVWVNGTLIGENLTRRGYAASIAAYGTHSSRDRAAVVHMSPPTEYDAPTTSAAIGKSTRAARPTGRLPSVKPRGNGITLSSPAPSSAKIEIFNAKGALIKRVSTDSKTSTFVPMPSKGLYIYRIKSGNDVVRGSVVVR
jgi:hypothetical protein